MKEIVSKILEVIMCLIPFFGKGKRERVVREVRYNATHKEVCNVKTTERAKEDEKDKSDCHSLFRHPCRP